MAVSLKRETGPKSEPGSMTLAEHLTEHRRRVLVCAVAFVVTGTVAFLLYPWILSFLKHPYCSVAPAHCQFYITGPLDGLALRVKIAAYGGLFLASPVLLWELWRFITPGLHSTEKRFAIPFVVGSIALFTLGCAVAFLTFPHALKWLDSIGGPSLNEIYDPTK
jgi:sec-independent protein translocase protein TatC